MTENINLFPMNAKYHYFNAPSLQNVKNALIHILGVLPVDLAKDSDVPLLIQSPLLGRSPTQSIYKTQCTSSFSSQKIFPDIHALPVRHSQFPSLQKHTVEPGVFGFRLQGCS